MEKCPICRTNIECLSVTKNALLEDLIKESIEEPQIINYYSIKMTKLNIISYYLRRTNIECPICFNQMKHPRILSCGHVVCFDCNKKFNWNKGKFISADIWRDKYYKIVLRNQNIILHYNNLCMKLKKNIQELIYYRDYFRTRMKYYKNKSIIYNRRLNRVTDNNYRTKICKWWIKGICKYSDEECSYAHGNKYLCQIKKVQKRK